MTRHLLYIWWCATVSKTIWTRPVANRFLTHISGPDTCITSADATKGNEILS